MFRLELEPIDYQLTVHFNNYETNCGKGSFAAHLNLLHNNKTEYMAKRYAAMYNFVQHYGEKKIIMFLTEVIGYKKVG